MTMLYPLQLQSLIHTEMVGKMSWVGRLIGWSTVFVFEVEDG